MTIRSRTCRSLWRSDWMRGKSFAPGFAWIFSRHERSEQTDTRHFALRSRRGRKKAHAFPAAHGVAPFAHSNRASEISAKDHSQRARLSDIRISDDQENLRARRLDPAEVIFHQNRILRLLGKLDFGTIQGPETLEEIGFGVDPEHGSSVPQTAREFFAQNFA